MNDSKCELIVYVIFLLLQADGLEDILPVLQRRGYTPESPERPDDVWMPVVAHEGRELFKVRHGG